MWACVMGVVPAALPEIHLYESVMLATRNARPTRTVQLKAIVERLVSEFSQIHQIYIFGSRRFRTGSVRSDIDLLFITESDTLDYHLPKRIRQVEPYIDAFQAVGGTALSFANHSQIKQDSRKGLLEELSAILLWSASSGWAAETAFDAIDVLSESAPEYTVAQLEPGVIDPARKLADAVLVTALQKEYAAICARLETIPGCERFTTDAGEMFEISSGNDDRRRIVVVRASRMGPVSAALETVLAIREWSPKLVVLAGIAAGIAAEHVQLGDLVIPDRVLEYEALKVEDEVSRFHGIVPAPSAAHTRRIVQWCGLSEWAKKWGSLLPEPRDQVVVHTDAIASGSKVVASGEFLAEIAILSRKVCSVEMEAIGVAEACGVLADPTPFIVVKAITDLADADKDDRYHPVASEAVADLLALLVEAGHIG